MLCFAAILLNAQFFNFAVTNFAVQILIFFLFASIPALKTKRMSYVDIAWPLGLVAIGLLGFAFAPKLTFRAIAINLVYLTMGSRMALGALFLWKNGGFKKEFPRYQYQRLRWKKKAYTNENIAMQIEIYVQAFANCSFLALPVLIQGANKNLELSWLEAIGYCLWLFFFLMESLADHQKLKFQMNKDNRKAVCDVGLWKYSRHPNYFAEWMVWNSIILATLASIFEMYKVSNTWAIVYLFALLLISTIMYQCLVHYTGAKPSEYYSQQKRPEYKEYMKRTNMFFPWFPRSALQTVQNT